jgi:hypothetical protein
VALAIDVAHAGPFGNDQQVANWAIPVGGAGISKRLGEHGLSLGVGLFA